MSSQYGKNHPDRKHKRLWPKVFSLLTSELNLTRVCDLSGLTRGQLSRLMRDIEFTTAFEEYREMALTASVAKAAYALSAGMTRMLEIIENPETSPTVKINAYRTVADYALKSLEFNTLSNRLSVLERTLTQGYGDCADASELE